MLPWVYGFTWQAGNVIFLSIFYGVAAVIFSTFGVAAVRALRDLKSHHTDEIRWHTDFNELPDFAKSCRHVLTGELNSRVCANGFDCRTCEMHAEVAKVSRLTDPSDSPESGNLRKAATSIFGLDMPTDRLYHRGHTWVRKESDGTLTIGLDEFGKRIIGRSARPELPEVGTKLVVNGTSWRFRNSDSRIRILSPVEGEVIAIGGESDGFYLKVQTGRDCDLRHLLKGTEIRPWMMRELERLEMILSTDKAGISLADGGELVEDMPASYPDADWESVLGEMFLEP